MELKDLAELLGIGKPTIRQYIELLSKEDLYIPKDVKGLIIYEDVAKEICQMRWLLLQGVNRTDAAKIVAGRLQSSLKLPEDIFSAFKATPKTTPDTKSSPKKEKKSRPLDELWDLFAAQLTDDDKLKLMRTAKLKNESEFRNRLLDYLIAKKDPGS
ncbi:hypothetical protein JJB07_18195 [Tumebacillus sp. ITR2]|uniref:HTH merR-type domain-containing protein n=1 Tax=Tumebacillus amylolyticus TaxID=2801339 RepID=A0ABS1JE14_9BACL|nr:hypothetical protein [Tumebacillus amylolyticus]MBL0388538.1 hypothetical protein [Tumebacillus amylolyticus]